MERTSISSVDSNPLLANSVRNQSNGWRFRILPRLSLRGASRILRRASNRRFLREPSVMVREAAADELEGRQNEWAYSKPIIVLDMLWNLAFVIVAVSILYSSQKEAPFVPLRLWILGYVLQCIVHSICVCIEYHRRNSSERSFSGSESGSRSWSSSEGSDARREYEEVQGQEEENTSVAKHLESINTMFSLLWWIIGFYWVSAGGQDLTRDAPQLYWLCIVFLAFDVFFVVFCVALASLIGIAVCCCLPCIIAILYAVADQEGASDEDICRLPKFIFRKVGDLEKLNWGISGPSGGIMTECGNDLPVEHFVAEEDAECCICLCPYDDGVELRELPCGHHFHCACIDKWLYINSTCPLCKYNIVKSNDHAVEEV